MNDTTSRRLDTIGFRIMITGLLGTVLLIPVAIFGSFAVGSAMLPVIMVGFAITAPATFGGLFLSCISDRGTR